MPTALLNHDEIFGKTKDAVVQGIREFFPILGKNRKLVLKDIHAADDLDPTDFAGQEKAKLSGGTWGVPIHGQVELVDNATGKVLDAGMVRLATLPKMTAHRFAHIVEGNEYQNPFQTRLKPAIYHRVKANDEIEAHINSARGQNLKIPFDRHTGVFKLTVGTSNIKLYPILRDLGVTDDEITKHWGADVLRANQQASHGTAETEIQKLYKNLYYHEKPVDREHAIEGVKHYLATMTEFDPEIMHHQVGARHSRLEPETFLLSTAKLLRMAHGGHEDDDRESLVVKNLHGLEDFLAERLKLARTKGGTVARLQSRADRKDTLREIISPEDIGKHITSFFTQTQLSSAEQQINPLHMMSMLQKITVHGEGGIQTEQAVTPEARGVHTSHFGFLDPVQTPESHAVGAVLHAAAGLLKEGNEMRTQAYDLRTGKKVTLNPKQMHDHRIAFPDDFDKNLKPHKDKVRILHKGEFDEVDAKDADYVLATPKTMFSQSTNMIPFMPSTSGNRALTTAKMQEQALPLVHREAPLVQVKDDDQGSFEKYLGDLYSFRSPVAGVVTKVDNGTVHIRSDGKVFKVNTYDNFPLNAKHFFHTDLKVKPGDTVTQGQSIGDTNYTKDNHLALGTNLKIAYMPWHGYNYEDGIVISEAAAKKLSSMHMHKESIQLDDATKIDSSLFRAHYPGHAPDDAYRHLDEQGLIRIGAKVNPGDMLAAVLKKSEPTVEDEAIRGIHKSLVKPWRNRALHWEHDVPGEIVKIGRNGKRLDIYIRTVEPMEVGDKMCYSADTDVLTRGGWKNVAEVTLDDEVATLSSTGHLEYHHPVRVDAYPHTGDMYSIQSQQIDLLVTLDHKMYVRGRNAEDFSLVAARDMAGQRVQFKKNAEWVGVEEPLLQIPDLEVLAGQGGVGSRTLRMPPIQMDNWLEFAGLWAADGFVNAHEGNYQVVITSRRKEKRQRILRSIASIGFKPCEREDRVVFYSAQLVRYLQALGNKREKTLPRFLANLSSRQIRIFLDAYQYLDGHAAKTSGHITADSYAEAGFVQELLLKAGWAGNLKIREFVPNSHFLMGSPSFEVRIVRTKLEPQINHGHVHSQSAQTEQIVSYAGTVFCCEVPNHVLYVRRNGKPCWSGNSGRHGNKGIVTKIMPEKEMPHGENGEPYEVLMNPQGIPSRMNLGTMLETASGKVAKKTGKPVIAENFSTGDNTEKVRTLLREHGFHPDGVENLTDPSDGRPLGAVQAGYQYFMKLDHSVSKKLNARNTAGYSSEGIPTRGNEEGSQSADPLFLYSMLSHGARHNLFEMAAVKSERNDEYWRALQTGRPTPAPKPTFVFEKFTALLKGMGVDVEKKGSQLILKPLTDEHVLKQSSGAIKVGRGLVAKDLSEEPGGLFDPHITGGTGGSKWSHIELPEPFPNPLFEDALKTVLGLDEKGFLALLEGKTPVDGKTGGEALVALAKKIDVPARLAQLKQESTSLTGQELNRAHKEMRYLDALQRNGLTPDKAYLLTKLPVIPPKFRPIYPLPDGNLLSSDLNYLYKDTFLNGQKLAESKGVLPDEDVAKIRMSMYQYMQGLYGLADAPSHRKYKGILDTVRGTSQSKEGLFQAKLVSRRQDLTGRSTIVVEPNMGPDEIGIPEDMAWAQYKPFVVRKLVSMGLTPLKAEEEIEHKSAIAHTALTHEMERRPVLANRAPSLHKFSVMAFKPRLVTGKAIQLHPLVTSGLSADFDGDQQLGSVFVALDAGFIESLLDSTTKVNPQWCNAAWWHARKVEVDVAARFDEQVGFLAGEDLYIVNLEDLPHEGTPRIKDHIEFFRSPPGINVLALNEKTGRVARAAVSHWSRHTDRRVEIVTLASGRQIITDDDPRAVYGLDSKLNYVRRRPRESEGMFVPFVHSLEESDDSSVTLSELPIPAGDKRTREVSPVDGRLGHLLGMFVGNGWVVTSGGNLTGAVAMATDDVPLGRAFAEDLSSVFLETPHIGQVERVGGDFGDDVRSMKYLVSSTAFSKFIEPLIGKGARNKHLPPFFLSAPRDFRLGLLAGLFDTDGSISVSNGKVKPQWMLNYSTTSIRLAQEISYLARSLSLKASITAASTPGGLECWVVTFSSVDMHKLGALPVRASSKSERFKRFFEGPAPEEKNSYSQKDIVPFPKDLAREIRKEIGTQHTRAYALLCPAVYHGYITRYSARGLLQAEPRLRTDPRLAAWVRLVDNNRVRWDRVLGYTTTDRCETGYDLTVPGFETFMSADGIILSNTMSVHVPVSEQAREEAFTMLPTNNPLNPGTGKLMMMPSQEAIVGLYLLTAKGKETTRKFDRIDDAVAAVKRGLVVPTDTVTIGKMRTSVGRYLYNQLLPEAHRNYDTQVTKGTLTKTLGNVLQSNPKDFGGTANALKDLGNLHATKSGYTMTLGDIKPLTKERDALLASADRAAALIRRLPIADEAKRLKIIDTYNTATDQLDAVLKKQDVSKNGLLQSVASGARGDWTQVRQILGAPMLLRGAGGKILATPARRSYAEGLSTADYFIQSFGARAGAVDRSKQTSVPGYFAKRLINANLDQVVTAEEDPNDAGVPIPVTSTHVLDRFLAADYPGIAKRGDLVTQDVASRLKRAGQTHVQVMSPLTSTLTNGVAAKSIGMMPGGQLPSVGDNVGVMSAQAMSEPATQLGLKSFHTGGVAKGGIGANLAGGMQRVLQLFEMPEVVAGAGTLATLDGTISRVDDAPQGGKYVVVGDVRHYVPATRELTVKPGDTVSKGQLITDGVVRPQDLLMLKGMRAVQDYLVDEIMNVYADQGINLRRVIVETAIRPLTNLARVKDPGDLDDTYMPGDYAPLHLLDHHVRQGKKVDYEPVIKGINTLPLFSNSDWLAQLNFRDLKKTIAKGASQGWSSDIHGMNPISAFVYSAEFGKGGIVPGSY